MPCVGIACIHFALQRQPQLLQHCDSLRRSICDFINKAVCLRPRQRVLQAFDAACIHGASQARPMRNQGLNKVSTRSQQSIKHLSTRCQKGVKKVSERCRKGIRKESKKVASAVICLDHGNEASRNPGTNEPGTITAVSPGGINNSRSN